MAPIGFNPPLVLVEVLLFGKLEKYCNIRKLFEYQKYFKN